MNTMKQLLFISIILLCTSICIAQSFAPIGATWHYSASANGGAPGHSEYYLYESQLDTIVGG
ncbi:MAG: hypothetical protein ABI729_08880, partial [Chitinophagales bacterium]